jgi:hypothetical protein
LQGRATQSTNRIWITFLRREFARGDFATLKDWGHEIGLGDNAPFPLDWELASDFGVSIGAKILQPNDTFKWFFAPKCRGLLLRAGASETERSSAPHGYKEHLVSPLSEKAQKFQDEIEKKLEQRKPFASRGFSVGTIDALVARGIDLPEHLLFIPESVLPELGLGDIPMIEIRSYRDRFR